MKAPQRCCLSLAVCLLALVWWFPGSASAIPVSPSHTGSQDLIYLPSVSFNVTQRLYDRNIDFGPEPITSEQVGTKSMMIIRNDFVFSDRFTLGFNLGTGTIDHGVIESGNDTFDAQGNLGAGGGFRASGVFLEDFYGADWFSDFQFFSLGSDPDAGRITEDDWHFAMGGRRHYGNSIVEGGLMYNASEYRILGESKNDTVVEGTGEASTNIGLFFNTRLPITKLVDGFASVQFTDEISLTFGASYDYPLGTYTPPVVRRPVEGAETRERPEQGESAGAFVRQAQRAIRQDNIQEALDFLSQAIDLDPQSPAVFYELGRSYYRVARFNRARDYLEYAVELSGDNPQYHYVLGRVYERLANTSEAVNHYERTVELDPTHQRALYRLNRLENGS